MVQRVSRRRAVSKNNMPTMPMFHDGGNVFCKVIIGKQELMFPHAIAELTVQQWEYALDAFGKEASTDLLRIGDKFYAVGETAENFQFTKRMGRPKYERDYYGVLFASAVGRLFHDSPNLLAEGLTVFASHATDDFDFRGNLVRSIKGSWKFECGGKEFKFDVPSVKTFEESYGGYLRRATHFNGQTWTAPLRGYDMGVIDIGGGTCGVLAVDKQGRKQPAMSKSGTQGVQGAIDRLRSMLHKKYNKQFSGTVRIPENRLREALQTGIYRGFGRELECHNEADSALAPLLNEINGLWMSYLGAGAGLDGVVLTGGGNGFLFERVMKLIGRTNAEGVLLAEEDLEHIQFANVRGARDFADAAETAGI